jgi:hypothetical protein
MATYTGESWSSPESDLDPGAFCQVCLIDLNPSGQPKLKKNCYLPIRRKPGGAIPKAAIRAAMGGRGVFGLGSQVPREAKVKAAKALISHATRAGIQVGESLRRLAGGR